MPRKQTVLYHYTSVEVLYKIINTRTFWLANSKSSNDKKENSLSIKTYRKMLEDIKNTCQQNDIKNALEIFLKNKETPSYDIENKKFFILSLTTQKDNLAHWERYASFRNGVSVALNADVLKMIRKKIHSMFQDDIIRECELIYTRQSCILKIKYEMENCYNVLRKFPKKHLEESLVVRINSLFSDILLHFKNIFFKDETERRILLDEKAMFDRKERLFSAIEMGNKEALKEIKNEYLRLLECLDIEKTYFSPIRGEIRSLHHLCLKDIWGSDLIPEIMLGPNCPQSKDELRAFLDANGLEKTDITVSKIPIR